MLKPESSDDKCVNEEYHASRTPSYVKISASAYARLLLAKMGSNHAVALVAKRLLQEGMQGKADES